MSEALCKYIAVRGGGTSSKKQQRWPESQFSELFNSNLDFYIHMYAVQDRSIYSMLFPKNIYPSLLDLLNNNSCSLFPWFPSVHQSASRIQLLMSKTLLSLLFLLYTKKKDHSIMSLFSLQHKPLTGKLPCLQAVAVLRILTKIALFLS